MAIDLYWDDEAQTTLLCVFDGQWSWDELFATLKTVQRLTGELDHEVSAVIDVRRGMTLPGGLFTPQTLERAKQLLGMPSQSGRKPGPMVVVGVNPMIRMIFDAVARLDRQAVARVQFVSTLAQARERLKAHPTP